MRRVIEPSVNAAKHLLDELIKVNQVPETLYAIEEEDIEDEDLVFFSKLNEDWILVYLYSGQVYENMKWSSYVQPRNELGWATNQSGLQVKHFYIDQGRSEWFDLAVCSDQKIEWYKAGGGI